MRSRWQLATFLAMPLLGVWAGQGLRARADTKLRSAIEQQYPSLDSAQIRAITVEHACLVPDGMERGTCERHAQLAVLSKVSLITAAAGISLFLVIGFAGLLARENRLILAYLFRPLLLFTIGSSILLVLAHGAIAAAAGFYAVTTLLQLFSMRLVVMPLLIAVVAAFAVAKGALAFGRKPKTFVFGKAVSRASEPTLWAFTENLAARLRSLTPDNIVVGLTPAFFVTEAIVNTPQGSLAGRTMYLSLPLCRTLTAGELTAVIGHELGHFKGSDTLYSKRFYPVYAGTRDALAALRRTEASVASVVIASPATAVFGYLYESFAAAERKISRDRELEADRCGSELASPIHLATALTKIHAFAPAWGTLDACVEALVRQRSSDTNLSKLFGGVIADLDPIDVRTIAVKKQSHPTDSHPPLSARLAALDVSFAEIEEALAEALFDDDGDAIDLVLLAENIEVELSAQYQYVAAKRFGLL